MTNAVYFKNRSGGLTPAGEAAPLPVNAGAVTDDTGATIYPDELSKTYAYDGDGNLSTITVTDGSTSWVKTFTYTAGNLTGETVWERA